MYETKFVNGNGVDKGYYENGQLRYETNYKDGIVDGLGKGWYENGQLKSEWSYKDGELISEKCWDEEGNEIDCLNKIYLTGHFYCIIKAYLIKLTLP